MQISQDWANPPGAHFWAESRGKQRSCTVWQNKVFKQKYGAEVVPQKNIGLIIELEKGKVSISIRGISPTKKKASEVYSMSNTSGARRAARRQSQDGSADKVVVDLDASSPVAGNHHGFSVFPGARTSPIDVEALDDEVQALSPSQVPPPGVNRRTRGQPVTPFSLDEDAILEENWRIIRQCATPFYLDEDATMEENRRTRSQFLTPLYLDENAALEDNAAMPSHNTWNKRQRVAPLICLSPEREEGSSQQSNNAVKISQEPAKVVVPKEPNFTCPVCLNKLVEPSTTKCGHIFCAECIKQAIQFQKKCPTCRKALRKNNFHRIYLPNSDG